MQNGHRTVEKNDFFQRQFFQEFFSFRQLRRAPQSSLAAKRTDFRRLRHEISRIVSCQKPVFCKGSLISPRTQFWFAELTEMNGFDYHIMKIKSVARPTQFTEPWKAASFHQPSSCWRRSPYQNFLDFRDQSLSFCFWLSVNVLVEFNRSMLLGSGNCL